MEEQGENEGGKGEGTLGGAGQGMFQPTVVCISWRLCLRLSQNQKHLTD